MFHFMYVGAKQPDRFHVTENQIGSLISMVGYIVFHSYVLQQFCTFSNVTFVLLSRYCATICNSQV